MAALSVQYSNGGIKVIHPRLFPVSITESLKPELADTTPAIAICLILVCFAAKTSLSNKILIIVD